MLKSIIAASLVAFAAAECPNACSGHGTCGKFDMCSCYSSWQDNDCSSRTCPFDLAHVDTPKGDLNGDLSVAGTSSTVISGSTVYPAGTTELYPLMANANSVTPISNTAHYYMECANKGLCDRTTGLCGCFPGYEGTACQRLSCPNSCSGHGTCETIQTIAALDFNNVYNLWDKHVTMGCNCDAGFTGSDCSSMTCKNGVDPLYVDSTVAKYTTVQVSIDGASAVTGHFSLVFYDVTGEDWETVAINSASTTICADVQNALINLPNSVITCPNYLSDVTTSAYLNSCVKCTYALTASGSGPTFTLQFLNNPGYLPIPTVNTYKAGVFEDLKAGTGPATAVVNTVQIGEFIDNWATSCNVAAVTVTSGGLIDAGSITTAQWKLLKACLGDSNGVSSDNIEVYNWDYGTSVNPHVIKAIHTSTGAIEYGFVIGSSANTLTHLNKLSPTTALSPVSLYATSGTATAFDTAAFPTTGSLNTLTSPTSFSCDDSVTENGVCLQVGSKIFVNDPASTATGTAQLFTVVKTSTTINPADNTITYTITLDYPIIGTPAVAKTIYLFTPSLLGAYQYVDTCSNRGTCDGATGLCKCFKGYTHDDCSIQSALAV